MTVDEILRTAARDLVADVGATVDAEAARAQVEAAGPGRRPWLAVAAALVAVLGLAAALLVVLGAGDDAAEEVTLGSSTTTTAPAAVGPAPGASEGLVITATPAEGLADGDEVRVVAEGLPDETAVQVELMMCAGDAMDRAPGTSRCQGAPIVESVTPADGRIDATYTVERIVNLGAVDEVLDCARLGTVACAIGVTVNRGVPEGETPLGPQLVGIVGVAFTPIGGASDPRLTVEPARDLGHGQVVTLEGQGFVGAVGAARLCAPRRDACTSIPLTGDGLPIGLPTDGDGGFDAEIPVWRALPVLVDSRWEVVDCAAVDCTLEVTGEDGRAAPPVRLAFADDTPLPGPPTLEVSPTTGLRPGDPVTVTVRGLRPGEEASLYACTLGDGITIGGCGRSTSLDPVVGDDDGEVTLTVPAVDPLRYGQSCTEPGVCAVTLGSLLDEGDPLLRLVTPVPVRYAP